jgi:hypothetical protein
MANVFLTGPQLVAMGILDQINQVIAPAGLVAVNQNGVLRIQDLSGDPTLKQVLGKRRMLSNPNFTDRVRQVIHSIHGAKAPK